ncbi:MAG: hypothetical protein J5716_02330 [Alphaproteobacteria bacterium]|nr:hypothetical protein [Alphaproteobacteria bacterium]
MVKSLKGSEKKKTSAAKEKPAVHIPLQGSKAKKEELTKIINEMCKSDAGRAILETAAYNGYELKFDPELEETGEYGYADQDERCCALNPANSMAENIATLAHELRHAYQFEYSKLTEDVYSEEYDTKTLLHKDRIMEADAESYGCLVAWELKQQGLEDCWNDFAAEFPNVTEAFEKTFKETEDKNKARTAAFKGWYDDTERRDSYDEGIVEEIESTSPDDFKKKLKSISAETFVEAFCTDPDTGMNYFTDDPSILESGKYTALYEDRKEAIKAHHQKREALPGRIPDKTIEGIEAQKRPGAERENNARAVSAEAKEVALASRQKRAAKQIKQQKKPSLALLKKKSKTR